MVRLVFRPYTQIRKAICTSAHLRASTRVSSGFALPRHSSPSFGSQQVCSHSNLSQKIMVGRWCACAPTSQVPYASWVYHPPTRIHVRLLGPCFKTGRLEPFRQRPERAGPQAAEARASRPRSARRWQPRVPPGQPTLTSAPRWGPRRERRGQNRGAPAASNRFPLNNFKHFLTLFSKFFSSFPHGTCSLSVSRPYLALDGLYHLLWAAFPNNPTPRTRLVEQAQPGRRGSHPLGRSVPGDLGPAACRGRVSRLQFAAPRRRDFQVGLFPVHSPLLGESLLVSFPPLSNMLKFGG